MPARYALRQVTQGLVDHGVGAARQIPRANVFTATTADEHHLVPDGDTRNTCHVEQRQVHRDAPDHGNAMAPNQDLATTDCRIVVERGYGIPSMNRDLS